MDPKFKCQLCNKKYTQPKMCPHCSHVYCHTCIRDYLIQKHFCPSCDNYIIDLVDCGRLVQEVEEVVHRKNGISSSKKLSSLELNGDGHEEGGMHHGEGTIINAKMCQIHTNLQLKYYCKSCQEWICSDCGVIDQLHAEHTVVSKSEGASKNKQNLSEQVVKISERIYKMQHEKQKLVLDLQVYCSELKWCKNQIMEYCRELLARADAQGSRTINQFKNKIEQYISQIERLKSRQENLQEAISSEKYIRSKDIHSLNIHDCENVNDENNDPWLQLQLQEQTCCFLEKTPKIKTIEEIMPEFTNFTYEFDFSNNSSQFYHYSDYFDLWGQEWRLKIYPRGNSEVKERYLSVFLELKNGYIGEQPKKYVYRIELISLNRAGCTIVKQYCSDFGIGQCWGYSDYLKLQHIEEYLHQGRLLFSVGIRNHTYAGLSTDLKKYIGKMQKETKILEKLLCESNYQKEGEGEGEGEEDHAMKSGCECSQSQSQSEIGREEMLIAEDSLDLSLNTHQQ